MDPQRRVRPEASIRHIDYLDFDHDHFITTPVHAMNAEETTRNLRSATEGFDALFANDLEKARQIFKATDSPFHSLGAGVCAFLEAALGMEVCTAAHYLAPRMSFMVVCVTLCSQVSWRKPQSYFLRRMLAQESSSPLPSRHTPQHVSLLVQNGNSSNPTLLSCMPSR